jgi:hypothetical protein
MDDSYLNSAGKRYVIRLSFDISIQMEGGRSWIDWFDQMTEVIYHSSETGSATNMSVCDSH